MRKLITHLVFWAINPPIFAADFWLPANLQLRFGGRAGYSIPFPTEFSGGAVTSVVGEGFAPIISGNYHRFKRIFAENPDGQDLVLDPNSGILIKAQNDKGFRVLQQSDKALNLGIASSANFQGWLMMGLELGISGHVGWGYTSSRFVPTMEKAKTIKELTIPKDLEKILDEWVPNDNLNFEKTLGLVLNVGYVSGPISVGFAGILNATWEVFVERLEGSEVLINYSIDKKKGWSFTVGAMITGFNYEEFFGKIKDITYVFDLSDKNKLPEIKIDATFKKGLFHRVKSFYNIGVLEAFREALLGNFTFADHLVEAGGFGIKKRQGPKSRVISSSRGFFLSIPFIFSKDDKIGKSFVVSRTKSITNELVHEDVKSIFINRQATSGVISRDLLRENFFVGNIEQTIAENPKLIPSVRRFSGNYKYLFLRNKIDKEGLERELKKIRFKVGQSKFLRGINFPMKDLGSIQLELDITLSDLAIEELMRYASAVKESEIINESLFYLDNYFNTVEFAKEELCQGLNIPFFRSCINYHRKKTRDATKLSIRALREMNRTKWDVDYKVFSKNFTKLGEGLTENRFTLKTFLRILKFGKIIGPVPFPKLATPGKKALFELPSMALLDEILTFENKPENFKIIRDRNGNFTRVPLEITFSIKGTHIQPVQRILYTYKDATHLSP